MRRLIAGCIALGLLLVAAGPAAAQGPFGGDSPMMKMMLLNSKDVRTDLKLTDEQEEKTKDLTRKTQDLFQGGFGDPDFRKKMEDLNKDIEKFFKETLKEEQNKRLDQIALQQQGGQAFRTRKVADELKLTDEQTRKMREIDREFQGEMRNMFQPGGGELPDFEKMFEKMAELRNKFMDKYVAVLDDTQKKKWKELAGEPFKGKIDMGAMFRPRP